MLCKNLLKLVFLIFIFACEDVYIIIYPSEKVEGRVYLYEGAQNQITGSRITIHQIDEFDFINEGKVIRESNVKDDSTFFIRLPKNDVPRTDLILRVANNYAGGLILYGFASNATVEVSLFTTVVYELLTTHTSISVADLSYEQVATLVELAKGIFYEKVSASYIQLDYSIPKIYKALKNALADSLVFMNAFNSFSKRNLLAEAPFGWSEQNTAPIIQSKSPFVIPGATVGMLETQSKFFDVSAADLEGAQLFYTWYLDDVLIDSSVNFDTFFQFETGYNDAGGHDIKVEISDGGQVTSFTWEVLIANKNRAPKVTSVCTGRSDLVEDETYICFIEAEDEDGDYPIVFEGFYYDNSTQTVLQEVDTPISGLPLCTSGLENCVTIVSDRSAFLTFTPTNCQTGSFFTSITLLDSFWNFYSIPQKYERSTYLYGLNLNVYDNNIEPEFQSFLNPLDYSEVENDISDGVPITFETTETYLFEKVIKVYDIDAISVADSGTNDDGALCADSIGLSFDTKPLRMTLTSLYQTSGNDPAMLGLYSISWRPRADQVNVTTGNLVKLRLTDSHGGIIFYQFYVKVNNLDQGPVLMARIPISYASPYNCSDYFDPSKVYDYDSGCIPEYLMEEYIKSKWDTTNVSYYTLRAPVPTPGAASFQNRLRIPVPGRDDYAGPLTLYEQSACPGQGDLSYNLSQIQFFVYHGDTDSKLTYSVELVEPNPLPGGYLGLSNQGNFTTKFKIVKAWGGSPIDEGVYDPGQWAQPQQVLFLTSETSGGFSYALANFYFCVNDVDTEITNVKLRVKVCDNDLTDADPDNGADDCDQVDMVFDLPERNQAPAFAVQNQSKAVDVNYMDKTCCDSSGLNCQSIADCEAVTECYDTYGVAKSWCEDAGLSSFQVIASDPDADTFNCSFTNPALAAQLGLNIDPSTCTISSDPGKPDWTNIGSHALTIEALDTVPAFGEPGYIAPGPLSSQITFSISVNDVNYPPYITSTPIINAQDGSLYTYNLTVTDPNINPEYKKVKFELEAVDPIPSNMSIDSTCISTPPYTCTGSVSWTPTDAQVIDGDILDFKIKATDCLGLCSDGSQKTVYQDVGINLTNVNQAPQLFSLKDTYTFLADGSTYSYIVSAIDPDAGDSVTITSNVGTLENYTDNSGVSGTSPVNLFASITPGSSQASDNPYTLFYSAKDNHNLDATNLNIFLNLVNKNKILSIPPKQAKVSVLYSYEVKGTKSKDLLTYSVVSSQIPCQFNNKNFLEFTPLAGNGGSTYSITIRVTDGSFYEDQTWSVKIKSTNSNPIFDSLDPDCTALINFIENDVFILSLSVLDLDSTDKVISSYFVDDVWIMDRQSISFPDPIDFVYYFDKTSFGTHKIDIKLTDGIGLATKTCNLNIINSYPVLSDTNFKDFSTKEIGIGIFNQEIDSVFTTTKTGTQNKVVKISNLSNLIDVSAFTDICNINFTPQRIVLDDTNIDLNNFKVYFAKYGDPNAAGNEFLRYRSISGGICDTSATYSSFVFNVSTYKYTGGLRFADITVNSVVKRYYINPSDRTKVKIIGSGTEIALSDEASNIYSLSNKNVIIAFIPDSELISVINPETDAIITQIDLSTVADPDLSFPYMAYYDATNKILYVYSSNGILSQIQLSSVDFLNPPAEYTITHFSGFEASIVTNDVFDLFYLNTVDNLMYLMTPDTKSFSIWDLSYSYNVNNLYWNEGTDVYSYFLYNANEGIFLVDKGSGKIIEIR